MSKNNPFSKAIIGAGMTIPSATDVSDAASKLGVPPSVAALKKFKQDADVVLGTLVNANQQVKTGKNAPEVKNDAPTPSRKR